MRKAGISKIGVVVGVRLLKDAIKMDYFAFSLSFPSLFELKNKN